MGLGALLENQLGHLQVSNCKFQKLHIYSISTSGVEIELIFHSMCSSFLHTCRFSKLPDLGRSCTYILFLSQGVKIELIFALRAAVSEIRADFENYHIWA